MYVYIWKDANGNPFYVGMGSTLGRTNPKGFRSRNRFCRAEVQRIGLDNIVVEVHSVPDELAAKAKEQELITHFGIRAAGTGNLTNLSKGGEYHAVTIKTKKTLTELWQDPVIRDKYVTPRIGLKRDLPESTKSILRTNLAANPAMKGWSERNGKDPEFDAKRIAGIKAAQPARAEKMRDPVALAQRKERLKATMQTPEYLAKRAALNTPEYRAKLSAAKKAYWAKKRADKEDTSCG
jgi:hypothetical protein